MPRKYTIQIVSDDNLTIWVSVPIVPLNSRNTELTSEEMKDIIFRGIDGAAVATGYHERYESDRPTI